MNLPDIWLSLIVLRYLYRASELFEANALICVNVKSPNYSNNFTFRRVIASIAQERHDLLEIYETCLLKVDYIESGLNGPIVTSGQISLLLVNLTLVLNFFFEKKCDFSLNRTAKHLVTRTVSTIALSNIRSQVKIVTRQHYFHTSV